MIRIVFFCASAYDVECLKATTGIEEIIVAGMVTTPETCTHLFSCQEMKSK